MTRFQKSVILAASPQDVFHFHLIPANLKIVQPPGARVLKADFPPQLALGSTASFVVSCGPFLQHWSIVIESLVQPSSTQDGLMVDRAIHSPFASWIHRHEFVVHGQGTRMTDVVDVTPPGGAWAPLLETPTRLFLFFLFSYRHWRTRQYFSTGMGAAK